MKIKSDPPLLSLPSQRLPLREQVLGCLCCWSALRLLSSSIVSALPLAHDKPTPTAIKFALSVGRLMSSLGVERSYSYDFVIIPV
jgi:hypothetical protein